MLVYALNHARMRVRVYREIKTARTSGIIHYRVTFDVDTVVEFAAAAVAAAANTEIWYMLDGGVLVGKTLPLLARLCVGRRVRNVILCVHHTGKQALRTTHIHKHHVDRIMAVVRTYASCKSQIDLATLVNIVIINSNRSTIRASTASLSDDFTHVHFLIPE